jgi:hypothetical protein
MTYGEAGEMLSSENEAVELNGVVPGREDQRRPPHRIGLAIWCLHISAILYVGVGLLILVLGSDDRTEFAPLFKVVIPSACLAMVIGIELVVVGLRRRRFWAWIAGLCVFSMYLPSVFLPLGFLGLWGLLDEGSRTEFRVGGKKDSAARTP